MSKVFVTICSAVVLFAFCASAQEQGGQIKKQNMEGLQVHGGRPSEGIPLPDVIKGKKLQNYPSATVGDAFSKYKYFSKVEWQSHQSASGKTYIDCIGQLKKKGFWDNVHYQQALEVKFVIYPNGEFGVMMVSRIDYKGDGKSEKFPLPDIKGVLDKIYANKEISF